MVSFTILSKYYRIIRKSIILNLNVYYNKLYFATILTSNYLFVPHRNSSTRKIEQDKYCFFTKQLDSWQDFEKDFEN